MARKSKEQRNAEQRVRQEKLRDNKREECRAERDDMARALLWVMIKETLGEKDPRKALDILRNSVVENLKSRTSTSSTPKTTSRRSLPGTSPVSTAVLRPSAKAPS